MKKNSLPVLTGSAVLLVASLSFAQDSKNQGYLVDSYSNSIVPSSNTGLCWRSSDWTPARAAEFCDPVAPMAEIPAPSVVAVAPSQTPAPAPAPAPVKVVLSSVNLSADTLFAFDKSVLKPEGKRLLDDFARQLDGAQYDAILVAGHTDRLGSNDYNQKLSERRADAVKEHLAGRNIPPGRIRTEGKGESQPMTLPGDCQGAQSVKVVACLQPDRRVHVEVTAVKNPAAIPR